MNAMSVLFASDSETKLNELTIHRTAASLPFGGRYRLIDFVLSNLVNSGISNIGIIARTNYNSLIDHIRMGRDWDLSRKNSGLAVFPPFVTSNTRDMYKSKVEALYSIIDFIEKAKEDYVIISNGNIAYNFDFEALYDAHIEKGADISILTYKSCPTTSRRLIPVIAKDGRVKSLLVSDTPSLEVVDIAINVYLMRKELLIKLIQDAYMRGQLDFEKDILMTNTKNLKIYAFGLEGYVAMIDDIKSFYNENMRLLNSDIRDDLFGAHGQIYTKVKDSPPTMYADKAVVKDSLIADGCIINGYVENSILFRGVNIEAGAKVTNSIVMEGGHIMKNSVANYVITDKNVVIQENRNISGFETYPIAIVKNKVV